MKKETDLRDLGDEFRNSKFVTKIFIIFFVMVFGGGIVWVGKTILFWFYGTFFDLYKVINAILGVNLVIAVVLLIIGTMTVYRSFISKEIRNFKWIIRVYLGGALFMASMYFISYSANPALFSLSAGINPIAEIDRTEESFELLKRARRRVGLLSSFYLRIAQLDSVLFKKYLSVDNNNWIRIKENLSVMHYNYIGFEGYHTQQLYLKDTIDTQKYWDALFTSHNDVIEILRSSKDKNVHLNNITKIIEYEENIVSSHINEMMGLTNLRVLNIIDFIYFSVITVATVGYGDIVPNSTTIRIFVILQVLFGLTLLTKYEKVEKVRDKGSKSKRLFYARNLKRIHKK